MEKSLKIDEYFSKFQNIAPHFLNFLVLRHKVSLCFWAEPIGKSFIEIEIWAMVLFPGSGEKWR